LTLWVSCGAQHGTCLGGSEVGSLGQSQRPTREMALRVRIRRTTNKTINNEHASPHYPNAVRVLDILHPDQLGCSTSAALSNGLDWARMGHGRQHFASEHAIWVKRGRASAQGRYWCEPEG
jgi:hypothetical protein